MHLPESCLHTLLNSPGPGVERYRHAICSARALMSTSLFVDDFAIYAEGKHLQHLERTIQLGINNVQKWVTDNSFRFSVSKTTCVHFHRQRIYTGHAIHLDGSRRNENLDKLAKAALNRASCSGKLICWSDLKPKINAYIHSVWQKNWDAEGANNLHEVIPNLGEDLHRRGEGAGRKRETVMCRLQDTSSSATAASASAASGFIDQYFGGEFETVYPFVFIVDNKCVDI
ncbi:RNA-directed DNA polymerase from mobile element jockey [Plakobranchus ocellatus]|uniref:RNA-directed DNA polymerase from mobile element jockey n=1 Tax=Plakobranchus ocellatus TaxID=259542 RepID=A0AAV4BJ51_9GAST|nr:RNA-directed DNA polymerase from mobile element jockey [Plakobranchus ocellatus]